MSLSQWSFETIGKEPRRLIGKPCQAVLLQQYWCKGELAETANVAYFMLGDEWISLSIDARVIFWRERLGPPEETFKELSGDDFSYPIVDIGAPYGLIGRVLIDIISKSIQGGSQVTLFFQGGSKLALNNIEDNTSFEINENPANS